MLVTEGVGSGAAALTIDVVTIFPELFAPFFATGVIGRAAATGTLALAAHDLRQWSLDFHHKVDDYPFGGGAGMVMTPQPLVDAVAALRSANAQVVLLGPRGSVFDQRQAHALAACPHLILVCGRYEGVDERVRDLAVDLEISLGDYVLSGGEVAAMVLIEAIGRLVPGVVGDPASLAQDSFASSPPLLGPPQYTRPRSFRGCEVAPVLLSGNHQLIARWRREQALKLTEELRADLLNDRKES